MLWLTLFILRANTTDEQSRTLLRDFIRDELAKIPGITRVISGMAQGFDQALAEAALDHSLLLTAAVPFDGMDAKWPAEGRRRFQSILAKADHVHVVCPGNYAKWKFVERDRWMVNNVDQILALHDGKPYPSGTGLTIAFAEEQGVLIANLWTKWERYLNEML